MRRGRHQEPAGDRDSGLADETEGFLLAHAHHEQARREAQDLCARMPWLTTAQAEDLTGHYIRRRLDVTRDLLLTTAHRADQLRQEYEARYAGLRRALLKRHTAGICAVLVCAGGTSALAHLLTR
ncbi:hypothetical protein [Streptomyces luteogriseus]|uniref:hypothetical protein n=1 Tax=Streptomyces luteogriseus TaxID=68233 RepID=UPI0037FB40BC